jgi:hypothetical protein
MGEGGRGLATIGFGGCFFCKTTFAKRPRQQALYSILFNQVLATMEFGNQTLAAKPYDGQGIELIFLKTSYSFEKRFLIQHIFKICPLIQQGMYNHHQTLRMGRNCVESQPIRSSSQ